MLFHTCRILYPCGSMQSVDTFTVSHPCGYQQHLLSRSANVESCKRAEKCSFPPADAECTLPLKPVSQYPALSSQTIN